MLVVAPYRTDVLFPRFPLMNIIFMVITIAMFFGLLFEVIEDVEKLILFDWGLSGMIGHMFVHFSFWHLFGNMAFLWVFGNAICTKMSGLGYGLLYIGGGLVAAATHLIFSGEPAIGASGAINCIVGFYLVVYPLNAISFFYLILWFLPPIGKCGQFAIPGFLVIILFFVFDIVGVARGGGGVAYWAHIGGFLFGVVSGLIVVAAGKITLTQHDHRTLCDILTGKNESTAKRKKLDRMRQSKPKVYVIDGE